MDLGGRWLAAPATDDLRRVAIEPGFDDAGWEPIEVPGHWRSTPAFAEADGPLLYRRRFEAERPPDGTRRWLALDGLFYQGDVWLDGAYLGDTEGYFNPHAFEVTEQLRDRTEHELTVEVSCAPQRDKKAKRNLTGVWQHWDCLDDTWNPVASGARCASSAAGPSASATSECCAGRRRPSRPPSASAPSSMRPHPARSPCGRPWPASTGRRCTPWPPGRTS